MALASRRFQLLAPDCNQNHEALVLLEASVEPSATDLRIMFSPAQPPLDGNGRIYLVGNGIVALDMNGAELWRHESSIPLRAATFGDGSLVLVRDNSLYVMAPDGSVQISLRAPEPLTSYPSIDAAGDVWIASATTLGLMR